MNDLQIKAILATTFSLETTLLLFFDKPLFLNKLKLILNYKQHRNTIQSVSSTKNEGYFKNHSD